ncbi:MAG: DUF2752 domain-containing protein [Bacteroidota bacterium]
MRRAMGGSLAVGARGFRAATAGVLLGGLALLRVLEPGEMPLPACLFHRLTGFSCPTCGMTRSLHSALHGLWNEAFGAHPAGPFLLFFVLAVAAALGAEAALGRRLPFPWRRAAGWGGFVLASGWILSGWLRFAGGV